MVSKRRVSEVEKATFSNSIYHRAPGPKEVFHGPSADMQIKERTPVGRRSGKGIEPRILLRLLQQFQELGLKTGALTQPSAPFCRWRSWGKREAVISSTPPEESWPGFLIHRLAMDFAFLPQVTVWTTAIWTNYAIPTAHIRSILINRWGFLNNNFSLMAVFSFYLLTTWGHCSALSLALRFLWVWKENQCHVPLF